MKNTDADLRLKILTAMLPQVPFDGWTKTAFQRALASAKVSAGEAELLFPQGIRDVIELWGEQTDAAMQQRIDLQHNFTRHRVTEKVAFGVRARLEYLAPHRDAVRRMMVWYALPSHAPLGLKRLYKTVDAIWRAAGDDATDFNFYTKRMLLAGVLQATIMFWLNDESDKCRESWDFLDRRLSDVSRLGKGISLIKEWLPRRRMA